MSDEQPPESDRLAGAPHPREARELFGQEAAEAEFLDAVRRDRLPHAWLVTGPRGIGKATLAWRIARFLLATSPGAPALSINTCSRRSMAKGSISKSPGISL